MPDTMTDLQGNVVPIPPGATSHPIDSGTDNAETMTDLQGNVVPVPKGATSHSLSDTRAPSGAGGSWEPESKVTGILNAAGHGLYKEPETDSEKGTTSAASPEAKNLGFTPKHIAYSGGSAIRDIGDFAHGLYTDLVQKPTPVLIPDKPGQETLAQKYVEGPSQHEAQRAREEADAYKRTHGLEAAGHAASSLIHTAGELIPAVGPLVGGLVDKAAAGDIGGAATQALVYHGAPEATEEATDLIKSGTKAAIPAIKSAADYARENAPPAIKSAADYARENAPPIVTAPLRGAAKIFDFGVKHPRMASAVVGGLAGALGIPGVEGNMHLAMELAAGGFLGGGLIPDKGLPESALNVGLSKENANLATADRAFKKATKEMAAASKQAQANYNENSELIPQAIRDRVDKANTEFDSALQNRDFALRNKQQAKVERTQGGPAPDTEEDAKIQHEWDQEQEQKLAKAAQDSRARAKAEQDAKSAARDATGENKEYAGENAKGRRIPKIEPDLPKVVTEPGLRGNNYTETTPAPAGGMPKIEPEPTPTERPTPAEGLPPISDFETPQETADRAHANWMRQKDTETLQAWKQRMRDAGSTQEPPTQAEGAALGEPNAEGSPEDMTKAEQVITQHTDQELARLGKKYGVDEKDYDFSKRDDRRHRIERDDFVNEVLSRMPKKDIDNIARLSDEFNKKDTTLWSESERNSLSKAQRSRAIMQEHEGGNQQNMTSEERAKAQEALAKKGAAGGAPEESKTYAREYNKTIPKAFGKGARVLSAEGAPEESLTKLAGENSRSTRGVPKISEPGIPETASEYTRRQFGADARANVSEPIHEPAGMLDNQAAASEVQRMQRSGMRDQVIPEENKSNIPRIGQAEAADLDTLAREEMRKMRAGGQIITDPVEELYNLKRKLSSSKSDPNVEGVSGRTVSPAETEMARARSGASYDFRTHGDTDSAVRTHSVAIKDGNGKSIGGIVAREDMTRPGTWTIQQSGVDSVPGSHVGRTGYAKLMEAARREANATGKPVKVQGDSVQSPEAIATWAGLIHEYPVDFDSTGRPSVEFSPSTKKSAPVIPEPLIREGRKTLTQVIPELKTEGAKLGTAPSSFISKLMDKMGIDDKVQDNLLEEYEGDMAALRAKLLKTTPEQLKKLQK